MYHWHAVTENTLAVQNFLKYIYLDYANAIKVMKFDAKGFYPQNVLNLNVIKQQESNLEILDTNVCWHFLWPESWITWYKWAQKLKKTTNNTYGKSDSASILSNSLLVVMGSNLVVI